MFQYTSPIAIRVTTSNRKRTAAIVLDENSPNHLKCVIRAANRKLNTNGTSLVLEKDGTIIDGDILITLWKDEKFMILTSTDIWLQNNATHVDENSSTSTLANSTGMIKGIMAVFFHDVLP